jgi:hypothetical protein
VRISAGYRRPLFAAAWQDGALTPPEAAGSPRAAGARG